MLLKDLFENIGEEFESVQTITSITSLTFVDVVGGYESFKRENQAYVTGAKALLNTNVGEVECTMDLELQFGHGTARAKIRGLVFDSNTVEYELGGNVGGNDIASLAEDDIDNLMSIVQDKWPQ